MSTHPKTNRPTHRVYHVVGDGEKARWTTIGAAWAHDDNDGMNLQFDYLPAGTAGRLVIRKAKPKNVDQSEEA